MGTSSNAPKETKSADGKDEHVFIREAGYMGRYVHNLQALPCYMRVTMCLICEEIKETELTEGPDTDGECWPMCEECWSDL